MCGAGGLGGRRRGAPGGGGGGLYDCYLEPASEEVSLQICLTGATERLPSTWLCILAVIQHMCYNSDYQVNLALILQLQPDLYAVYNSDKSDWT